MVFPTHTGPSWPAPQYQMVFTTGLSALTKLSHAAAKTAYGTSSIQGRRASQEDRFFACEQLPGAPGCGFYAVYDGHGGERAAEYATGTMHERLVRTSAFKKGDLALALEQAFHEVETEFLKIATREGLRDGTTAVVALVEEEKLTIAHVGDSRGVLCRAGSALPITQDHKPEMEAERKRIEALGGFISYIGCWRTMGILAMSRALGDLFLKPYVSATPDVLVRPYLAHRDPTAQRRAAWHSAAWHAAVPYGSAP